jgi:uncharacterized protein YecT (DUF1311 family)
MRVKIFLAAILAAFCFCAFSEATLAEASEIVEDHPIDIQLEKEIDADPSTAGMIKAIQKAIEAWDKELNKNYQALMKKLDKKNQEKLRASQREWVKYRDLEFEFNNNFWANFDGTMYLLFPLDFQLEFIKERTLSLGSYLEGLSME